MDCTRADMSSLQSGEIAQRANTLSDMASLIGRQRIAWAVKGPEDFRATRLFLLHMNWESGFVGRAFTSLPEAREWLRQPPDSSSDAQVVPRP